MSELSDSTLVFEDLDDSTSSSSSSSNLIEDNASSSLDSSCSPLNDFSVLMASLPIKRSLSQFFNGKSQSFALIFEAKCIQDLAKKENPYSKRMKYSGRNDKVNPNSYWLNHTKQSLDVFF